MPELFHHDTHAESPEGWRAARREAEGKMEIIEAARQAWLENIRLLDESVPHNDVLVDTTTMSYHVARNAWCAEIDNLDKEESHLQGILAQIEEKLEHGMS